MQHLIQKQCATVGALQVPGDRLDGACKRSTPMSKQEALGDIVGQGAAVDVDELAPSPADMVDMSSEQLLSGSGRANKQDW